MSNNQRSFNAMNQAPVADISADVRQRGHGIWLRPFMPGVLRTNRRLELPGMGHTVAALALRPCTSSQSFILSRALGYFVFVAGLIFSGTAFAQAAADSSTPDKPASDKSASERLTQIEAETLLLKAREKQIDVQASIITKQNEIILKQALNDQLTNKAVAGDPLVRSIEGIGKAMYATLQLHNGNLIDAKAGDVLPNGMKVVSIRPNEVIVQSANKRRTRLGGASPAPVAGEFNPNYPSPGLSLPPLPVAVPGR